jgi:hypothetical protein
LVEGGETYFSLKEQNCWLITCQTISSDAIAAVGWEERWCVIAAMLAAEIWIKKFTNCNPQFSVSLWRCYPWPLVWLNMECAAMMLIKSRRL